MTNKTDFRQISFKATKEEHDLATAIAHRALGVLRRLHIDCDLMTMVMDITATNANGCPLDMPALLAADDFNFSHDIGGIRRHLNRDTGELGGCFVPRFARRR